MDLFVEERQRINSEFKAAKEAIQDAEQEWEAIEGANNILFDLIPNWEKIYRLRRIPSSGQLTGQALPRSLSMPSNPSRLSWSIHLPESVWSPISIWP
jgi:hypothetical protein